MVVRKIVVGNHPLARAGNSKPRMIQIAVRLNFVSLIVRLTMNRHSRVKKRVKAKPQFGASSKIQFWLLCFSPLGPLCRLFGPKSCKNKHWKFWRNTPAKKSLKNWKSLKSGNSRKNMALHQKYFKQPKKIIIINKIDTLDEIPKGPTKKVLYRKLKEYYKKFY